MDNKDILLLKTLYEEKNITHTAKRLFLSQPALTDRLKRLEAEFGCTLFLRQPRGIQFTSEGELLYRFFLQMESSYQKIRDSLSDARIHPAGTLSIACSNVFAKYHMPRILTQFRKTYPRIEIHMKSGFSHDRYRDFLEGKYHICIVRGDHNWNEEKRLLWQDPLCAFSREPLNMDLLPSYPYIHYVTDPLLQNVLDDWWYAHYRKPPLTIIETDAMDTCLKMVQEGLGFTLLSRIPPGSPPPCSPPWKGSPCSGKPGCSTGKTTATWPVSGPLWSLWRRSTKGAAQAQPQSTVSCQRSTADGRGCEKITPPGKETIQLYRRTWNSRPICQHRPATSPVSR